MVLSQLCYIIKEKTYIIPTFYLVAYSSRQRLLN